MQYYKLPDGKTTADPQEYGNAWKELYAKVEKHFPGYRCSGYDPHIHMTPIYSSPWRNDSFNLPVAAVLVLK